MSSITKKANGSYVVRVSTGKDYKGKYTSVSKVFRPSKPNLSYASLQRELNMFRENLELQVQNGDITSPNSVPKDHRRTLFEDFCKIFLEIKKTEISPATHAFYGKIIEQHLIPTYGKMHMDEFRIRHVQDFIQFIVSKRREDFHGLGQPVAASTVKRYTTVFRSIYAKNYNKLKANKKEPKFFCRRHFQAILAMSVIHRESREKICFPPPRADCSARICVTPRRMKLLGKYCQTIICVCP